MITKPNSIPDLEQAIIELHNIARLVERDIGSGELSHQIRDAADTLTTLVRYSKPL